MLTRVARVEPDVRGPAALFVDQLSAIACGDADALIATFSDDIVVRVWGWEPGGRWTWRGQAARDAAVTALASNGTAIATMRIDVDRFLPGFETLALDGELSWLRPSTTTSTSDVSTHLAVRRVAVFLTVDDDRAQLVDVYVDVHETMVVSDRSR